MYNPVLKFKKSPTTNVKKYTVQWKLNGTPLGQVELVVSSTADSFGYSTSWNDTNMASLKEGSVVEAVVTAVTETGKQSDPVSAKLTIPDVAPAGPTDVTLTL